VSQIDIGDDSVIGKLLRSLGPFGFVAVDADRVNLDDLINSGGAAGSIVRCIGNPSDCIAVYASEQADTLGCVAGWISDGD
jgi:hypothetical protein